MRLAFSTLIPRVRLFLCRCVAMASLKQARSVTPARVTIRRAVIHRPANSQPEPCVTQVVRLAVQPIASSLRRRSYAGSPRMIGVIRPSFVPVIRRHVQRISLSQMVGTSCVSSPHCSHTSLRPKLWDWRTSVRQWYLHVIGLYVSFVPGRSLRRILTVVQRNASRQVPHSGWPKHAQLRMIGHVKSHARIPKQPTSVLCYRHNLLMVRLAVRATLFTATKPF